MTKLELICQAIYQLLEPDFGSTLYVARSEPFSLAELPVTNVWPLGEPAPDRHSGMVKRVLEMAVVSQFTGTGALQQVEVRRALIHKLLLSSTSLGGAQMIQAGDWQVAPDPELPVLTLTQQFFVYYQHDFLEI